MTSTGHIRRIDDLGRVVIPKEVRERYGIRIGEPFEIFLNGDDIVLRSLELNKVRKDEIDAQTHS